MQFKKPVAFWLASLFLALITSPLNAQDADADLVSEPIDTVSDFLVAKGAGPNPYSITDKIISERLSQLTGCLQLRNTGVVKGYIRTYVQSKPEKTRQMLGRRLTYFPLFERKLKEHGLPADLKYLSVVESALNAKAVSKVGATGLWQFMPYTGSDYGLRQNSVVDERIDPVEATDAAMRYLKDLYRQYNDWALAMAAYNSGPTRVNSAIKKAHSRNFWAIQRYLPEETRNYVPAFIAASYICNYFPQHELQPRHPDYDEQLTDFLRVYDALSFRDISDATGIDYTVIKNLNPGYKRDYVPANTNGHFIILPKRVMPAFVRYLNSLGSRSYSLDGNSEYAGGIAGEGRYTQMTLSVQQGESVESFAQKIGMCGSHLQAWNDLSSQYLHAGQKIQVWRPVFVQKHQNLNIEAPAQAGKPKKSEQVYNTAHPRKDSPAAVAESPRPVVVRREQSPSQGAQFQWHTVRRNESLEDIARQYSVSAENIRKLNSLSTVQFGMRLKVREL
jgi:membrane-bound lytic murein transglycosylase D